MKEATSG